MHKKLNLFPNTWFSRPDGKLEKDCIEAADKDNGLSESGSELLLPALMMKMMLVIIIKMVLMIIMVVVIWWLITNQNQRHVCQKKISTKTTYKTPNKSKSIKTPKIGTKREDKS